MKLLTIDVRNYRSLRETNVTVDSLTLFFGANASGKSSILDALRFLSEVVRARDFEAPVYSRGNFLNLAWKGQDASYISLVVSLKDADTRYDWFVRLVRTDHDFFVEEQVYQALQGQPRAELLNAKNGDGWWWSGEEQRSVTLKQSPTACAQSAASADASFAAREVTEFISRWGFFDPSPYLLRPGRNFRRIHAV